MKKLAAIRIDIASCAQGEGVLTHPSPDSRDRKGNLVSRQHTDCLNMVNKVAALPMRPESTGHKSAKQWWSVENRAPANYKEPLLGSILCSATHRFWA